MQSHCISLRLDMMKTKRYLVIKYIVNGVPKRNFIIIQVMIRENQSPTLMVTYNNEWISCAVVIIYTLQIDLEVHSGWWYVRTWLSPVFITPLMCLLCRYIFIVTDVCQGLFTAGPTSETLAQQWTDIGNKWKCWYHLSMGIQYSSDSLGVLWCDMIHRREEAPDLLWLRRVD